MELKQTQVYGYEMRVHGTAFTNLPLSKGFNFVGVATSNLRVELRRVMLIQL